MNAVLLVVPNDMIREAISKHHTWLPLVEVWPIVLVTFNV